MTLVLFIQDPWPDSVAATGFATGGSLVQRGLPAVERRVPESKVTVVYNWTDESASACNTDGPGLRARLNIPETYLVLVYAGNHGPAQGLGSWIEAMRLLGSSRDIHLVLIGSGLAKPGLMKQAAKWTNVEFVDAVPRDCVNAALADCDALVVSLANEPLFEITLPGKVQSCLEMGKPIVASVAGDAADVIGDSGGGWCAPPEDPVAIAEMVSNVAGVPWEEMHSVGSRGRDFYFANMSRAQGVEQVRNLLVSASLKRNPRTKDRS